MDFDQIGQAIVGLCILGGFVAQQLSARKRAETIKQTAQAEAARVAAVAQLEAANVAKKVDQAGTETREALHDINIMVDGRLDGLFAEVHRLQGEIDRLKGDAPGTAAHESGPQTYHGDDYPPTLEE